MGFAAGQVLVYCIWHTIVNLAQILKYQTFDSACRSQVGGISKCTYGFGAGKVVVYYGFRHAIVNS